MTDEMNKKTEQLTDDEMDQAAGGFDYPEKTWTLKCQSCGNIFTVEADILMPCPVCKSRGARPVNL